MSVNNLLSSDRQTWKAPNLEDLIVQGQTILQDLEVDGTISGSGFSNVVTSSSTNTSGNVMTGAGGKAIQDSGKAITSLMSGPTTSVRTIYARYDPTGGVNVVLESGYGFSTASYTGTGRYQLTFSSAFTEAPNVQALIIQPSTSITQKVQIFVSDIQTTGCKIFIIDPGVSWYDYKFNVFVVGK